MLPLSSYRFTTFVLLTLLILTFISIQVSAVKFVEVTPAIVKYRRELAKKYQRKRELSKPKPVLPVPPRLRTSPVSSLNKPVSAFSRKPNRKRQDLNLSCNNITITPPGFDGSCAPGLPCPNGACCGQSGFCGYGSSFCGTGCTSNCDAVAECGPNAAPGTEICPLNVCCSQFGFCGSTEEFCGTGCVGPNCGEPAVPTSVNSAVTSRVIGYYEGWASSRPCDAWLPQNIPSSAYTHLNYAFASIDPVSFNIVPASSSDIPQYTEFTNLKQSNPTLQTYISVGGWSFNDPPTQQVFSNTASTPANRQAFATSLVNFLIQYGFDGVDIDWEYPVACERGGVDADKVNMVLLFQTIRQTFDASGHTFGLTFTAPSSFWYLQHFDLLGLLTYANWVNLMSYDLHGVWDSKDVYIGSIVQAHTNLTEIAQSIQLFQRVGVPLDRIVLGIGFYGRSFQLSDPTCTTPGCHFSGPAPGGPCTASDGTLSFSEIQEVIGGSPNLPVYDQTAQVKYLVYDDNNWVSYDDAVTLQAKVNWAKGAGLGGLMVWSADQDDFNSTAISALLGESIQSDSIPRARDLNSHDGATCMQPDCGNSCPSGYVQMTDTTDGELANPTSDCGGGDIGRPVCCPVDQQPKNCLWRGTAPLCNGVCLPGEITLAADSWGTGHKCSSGHKAFCCESGLSTAQIEAATDCQCCNDNVCPPGTFTKDRDYFGDTGLDHACWSQEKSLCCFPPFGASTTSPFDLNDLFPNPPANGGLIWDLQDDPIDENAPNGGNDADDNSFGLIALDGPPNLLSSVGASSDWVVLGCTQDTENLQRVVAFCRKPEDDPTSGCSAVFQSGAKNTIVNMPPGCGGPFSRIAHLEVNNDLAVPEEYAHRKPPSNPVYEMHFDYKFHLMAETRSAETDGAILVRADATTLPGYWAEIDTADPGSSVRRDLEERWFGAFGDWLSRVTKVKSNSNADLLMQKSFSTVLFSASQHCTNNDGTLTLDASMSITAQGEAHAHLNYGFYLEGSVFPFNIDNAYIYADSDAGASLGFEVTGRADVQYNSGRIPLIPEIAWPGLSWPGLVTIGPTFNIYGQLDGQLALSGTFGVTSKYTLPEGHVALGLVNNAQTTVDQGKTAGVFPGEFGWNVNPTIDVELGGSLAVHVIPEGAVVFNIFPGTPASIGAEATLTIDGAIILSFTANTQGVDARVDAQVDFLAGATGLGATAGPYNFFHTDYTIYEVAFNSAQSTQRRSLPATDNSSIILTHSPSIPFMEGPNCPFEDSLQLAARSAMAPRSLFSGLLNCPTTNSGSDAPGSCAAALADDVPDFDPDDGDDEVTRREFSLHRRVVVSGCSGLTITRPGVANTRPDGIWDLALPTELSTIVADWGVKQDYAKKLVSSPKNDGYAKEHVYEMQLLTQFMTDVIVNNVDLNGMSACNWLQTYVFSPFGTQGVTLSRALAAIQPTGRDEMPVLVATANSAKEAFLASQKEFRKVNTMADKTASDVLFLLRAAGAATDYFQDKTMELEFKRRADAVRQLWINFIAEYKALVKPQMNFDVSSAYVTWINGLLTGFNTNAQTFLGNAKAVLKSKIPSGQNTVQVQLPIRCFPTVTIDISAADIDALSYTQVTWTYL